MTKMEKQRCSSYEVIKIIAIICIICCHSIPTDRIEYRYATMDPWLFGVMMLRQLGSVGNAIFMVASAWFLIDNDMINFSKAKAIIANNQIISIIFLVIMQGHYEIGIKVAIKQIFPFVFSVLWYVTAYVMYYCLHGFINKALRATKIRTRFAILILAIYIVVVACVGGMYFNELGGFIIIHALTWFIRKEMEEYNEEKIANIGRGMLCFGILGWILGAVVLNIVGIKVEMVGQKFYCWNKFYNPFILAIAYGSMCWASTKQFCSEHINFISGCSLYIYMITGNQLLRMYFDNGIYDYICSGIESSFKVCFVFVIIYVFVKIFVGFLFALFYKKTIATIVEIIVKKEFNFIAKMIYKT